MFRDVETTSGHPDVDGLNAYNGARIVGYAISWRNTDGKQTPIYYISLRHKDAWASNIDLKANAEFIAWCNLQAGRWVNHNVKFDAHLCAMETDIAGVDTGLYFYTGDWYDTIISAKLLDSDRMEYDLKGLAEDWLGIKPELRDEVKAYLKARKSQDYGDVPSTLLGDYAINDIWINTQLYDFINSKLDGSLAAVHHTERRLTAVLFDMEREGVKIDLVAMRKLKIKTIEEILELECELRELTGYEFSNSSKSLKFIILQHFQLPVVAITENVKYVDGVKVVKKGGPSFDAEALEMYCALPEVVNDTTKSRFFEALTFWREKSMFLSLYLDGWEPHIDSNGRLHANYNQIIRTGRMSCSAPNLQQLNKAAKALIICEAWEELCSNDASQIEFRLIAHYMGYVGDRGAIDAYNNDPATDYHMWVAILCEIARSPAKNINFMKAYGGGKAKMIRMLRGQKAVIAAVKAQVDALVAEGRINESNRVATYAALIEQRAVDIIAKYEERLPGIKKASDLAAQTCRARGYVTNLWGRRRHLPANRAHIAFNTAVQGGAMDFIKTRMVAASPRFNSVLREANIRLILNVHDELVHVGPKGTFTPEVQEWLRDLLSEQDPVKLEVPILWSGGVSDVNWAKAA